MQNEYNPSFQHSYKGLELTCRRVSGFKQKRRVKGISEKGKIGTKAQSKIVMNIEKEVIRNYL